MPRPTKASLQKSLLDGKAVKYKDGSKQSAVELAKPQSRRLFRFLLDSDVREAKDLPKAFIEGLWLAYSAEDATSSDSPKTTGFGQDVTRRIWRVERLTTKNFGGLNVHGGNDFVWELKGESWLLDGENASGKSSLLGAIAWAFSGIRPRDEATSAADVHADVLDESDAKIGSWPPLACYPNEAKALATSPEVEVTVDLVSDDGQTAIVQRALRTGKVHAHRTVEIDEVFISTGIEMPLVLPSLRLKDKGGEGALTRAVSQLTGLEELVRVGELAEGLCHGAREYFSYAKKAGLPAKLTSFDAGISEARQELRLVNQQLPEFSPKDAVGKDAPMVLALTQIERSASSLAGSLVDDLAANTDTSKLEIQREIIVAVTNASEAVSQALVNTREWKAFESIEQSLNSAAATAVLDAVKIAENQVEEALAANAKQQRDDRYRLKAIASSWHAEHRAGPVEQCPLCDQGLHGVPELKAELDSLCKSGPIATQTLQQSLLTIRESLMTSLPTPVASAVVSPISPPRQTLIDAVRREMGSGAKFCKLLRRLAELVEEALVSPPSRELTLEARRTEEFASAEHEALTLTLQRIRMVVELANWFRDVRDDWIAWWDGIAADSVMTGDDKTDKKETVRAHLKRLTDAMDGAKPFARAAGTLRQAVTLGESIREIQLEQERREKVVDALLPMKQLPALAQSVARQAIDDLSGRISTILDGMHTSERFRYRTASLQKREGLVVRGSFESDIRIDATLIANTSWLRSTLWAFIFALRQEAVEQYGIDPLPVWLFDDPQTTFDMAHRLNWSSYVAGLQVATPRAQIVIATHDEAFAAKLRQSSLKSHEAVLKPATVDTGPLEVLEGSRVGRRWEDANADRSAKTAIAYLSDVRVFLEGMLKAMLAGEGADIRAKSVSDLRTRMIELGRHGRAPWDKLNFAELAKVLDHPAMKYVHQSHHSDRDQLTFAEAKGVSVIWPQLSRLLTQCFKDIRDHRLLHGMPSAFQLAPPSAEFPEGFAALLAKQSLPLLGRASAFSGRISEGTLNYEEYDVATTRGVRLAQHGAYRLMARTLEPVARPGDILLVHEVLEPLFRSLAVAITEDQLVARRYVISEASSDVAVLTANALDPYEIAPPIVARKETIKARRIVGVLFDRKASMDGSQEVQACRSESEVQSILSRCKGLVEVAGQSAQPLALNGQYLLIGDKVSSGTQLKYLDGAPVIALDSDNGRYFKRLRLAGGGLIILESLDGGGEYPPEVLWETADKGRTIEEVWEVLGVLFELP